MDDTDLSGLDLASAREYVLAHAVDAKRLEKEFDGIERDLALWRGRVALAEGKAMGELAAAARARCAELESKKAALASERDELRAKVARMRERLPMIRAKERSVDPDRLLAELQLMTGELLGPAGAASEADFARLEADSKAESGLAALKGRPSGDPGGDGPPAAP